MKNKLFSVIILFLMTIYMLFIFTGCGNGLKQSMDKNNDTIDSESTGETKPSPTPEVSSEVSPEVSPEIDLFKVLPNENGKIMVVMFHNFIETYVSGDKEYTTTFDEFRKLLENLYERDYRLINMEDFLTNNISVPAGCIPMVFTFDDGTPGQFNLIEENGELKANPNSAVGILEEFNRTHPDFGLKGTFYVNLGLNTFHGEGTLKQRLEYLIDKGFEIGNHTYSHINLSNTGSAEKITEEIGRNQAEMDKLVKGYKMLTFSLPFGAPSNNLMDFVVEGNYQEIKYKHLALMEVGANPTVSSIDKKFNPRSVARVRASGIEPVMMDLGWWLDNLARKGQYISDGNPHTVTVPKGTEDSIDLTKLGDRKLITY